MRRRQFITLLSGAASSSVSWPLAAHAQLSRKLPVIGFLGAGTPSTWGGFASAFVQRLRDLGWIEGSTVVFEYRWREGRSERFSERQRICSAQGGHDRDWGDAAGCRG
jgi:putative ABC transport system substrate-binding protein